MKVVRNTEEMSTMKVRLLAVTFGFFLAAGGAYAGPTPGGPDSDGDGVENAFDNCVSVSNASQTDTDHNGCGDACTQSIDCDFNHDKAVGSPDFAILRSHFGQSVTPGTNGDFAAATPNSPPNGSVGSVDFAKLRSQFGHLVGPSGITNAQCDTATCRCTPQ